MSIFLRTVKNAFRTVLFNWREYAGFFLALIVVQGIFWSLTFSLDTNNMAAERMVSESYSYHVLIPDLTPTQTATFKNLLNRQTEIDDSFFEVEIIEKGEGSEAHVLLKGSNLSRSFSKFRENCMMMSWAYSFTPLYTYQTEYVTPGIVRYVLVTLGMLLLCAVVLIVLYTIRIENHQFQYGIYMTCGGDFRTLFRVAFWELAAIGVLTFVPSMLLSALLMLCVYLPQGILFCFDWAAPLKVLLLSAIAILLSVWLPVRIMHAKTPMSLITSRDNAGYVSSPRRSFRLVGKSFPRDYELAGMWRFRKYYVRLVCSAVAFASLFISGLYIAEMIRTEQTVASDEFVLAFGNMPDQPVLDEDGNEIIPFYPSEQADAMNDDVAYLSQAIRNIRGVAYVNADEQVRADALLSHMLIKKENAYSHGEYGVVSTDERDGYEIATDSYKYTAVDREWLDSAIASGRYQFEGDPYAVLEDPHAIIISQSILGIQRFDFSVGDRVYFATYVSGNIPEAKLTTRRDHILMERLEYFTFDYGATGTFSGEYVVCAVMTRAPADSYLTVGVQVDTYRALTGEDGARDVMTVYLEDDISLARADEIAEEISVLAQDFAWNYRRNGTFFDSMVAKARCDHLIAAIISVFILIVSPLVWFCSQLLFYRKREGEFYMLSAMGGFSHEIGVMHLTAGAVLSAVAFAVTLGMSYLFNFSLYYLMGQLLPSLGFVPAVSYHYYMPLWALALCAAVSVACGFASCIVPYFVYKHRMQRHRAKEEG